MLGGHLQNLREADQGFPLVASEYDEASRQFNEFNLNVTRQQSKINSLKQELEFRNKQLHDLRNQVEANTSQLGDTTARLMNRMAPCRHP